jgi:hypothetical protein
MFASRELVRAKILARVLLLAGKLKVASCALEQGSKRLADDPVAAVWPSSHKWLVVIAVILGAMNDSRGIRREPEPVLL